MNAMVIDACGGPAVWRLQNVPDPVAGEGEVLVGVAAAGIHPGDTFERAGLAQADGPVQPTRVAGWDVAGIVPTFVDVDRYGVTLASETGALSGSGEPAARLGRLRDRCRVGSRVVDAPSAVLKEVRDGRRFHLRFMEDALATGASFRSDGSWTFRGNPHGEEATFRP